MADLFEAFTIEELTNAAVCHVGQAHMQLASPFAGGARLVEARKHLLRALDMVETIDARQRNATNLEAANG